MVNVGSDFRCGIVLRTEIRDKLFPSAILVEVPIAPRNCYVDWLSISLVGESYVVIKELPPGSP